jgi:hypothetical protein
LEMSVSGITPTASQLTRLKTGKKKSAGCRLCRIARGTRGGSTDGLTVETYCDINSAGCEGMTTGVMATHHSICRPVKEITSQNLWSRINLVTNQSMNQLQPFASGVSFNPNHQSQSHSSLCDGS